MPADVLRRLLRRYVTLSARYEERLGSRREHIVLKRDHSLRVHALAVRIMRRESLPETSAHLAAALLHDVGRFTQFEAYGTYRDDCSVDHGDLGAEVLENGNLLEQFDPVLRTHIIDAVRQHNKRVLPDGLAPLTLSICNLIRDADKLDIVPVVLGKMLPGGPRDSVVTLGLTDDPRCWTPAVFETVTAGTSPAYADMRYLNDFALLLASWGPGLELAASRGLFLKRGHLERLFAILPPSRAFAALQEHLLARLQRS